LLQQTLDNRAGHVTCVPPSPGRVLYHNPSCGPANGSWSCSWSPCAATAAAKLRRAEESFMFAKKARK
jgi:hypothetical protein